MGIFELADFTGMDVIHKATTEMYLRDKKVILPHITIEKMFDAKKLGQKSGEGFYKYSDDKYERVALSEEMAQKCNPIQLVANILNNAAWLVTNKASDIEEIEKAAFLGLGLKKPLFETAKEIGIKNIVNELNQLASKHGKFYEPDPLLISMQ
jgi:enoyl-CoA hydratase/3-hydroxyacyl-CoA dehydrogenase